MDKITIDKHTYSCALSEIAFTVGTLKGINGALETLSEKSASVRESRTEGNGLVHRQRNEQDPDFSAVDAETFDPETHEWIQVVVQRGHNHTTVTKEPTGPALFSYGKPNTYIPIKKGIFSQEELTEFAGKLSKILADMLKSGVSQ